jgi:hypothetical protein
MATTREASRDQDQAQLGQHVAVQLAVQGWAVTRPGRASTPDDPCDPVA